MSSVKGCIFNIAHYTIHDGPGIRTTVFLKGCPARCLWCCSPESQNFTREILFRTSNCVSCGRCFNACPKGAVLFDRGLMSGINRERCISCGECSSVCMNDALVMSGRDVTAFELFTEVRRDEPFWQRSHGGVTLSGGEVLAQPQFVNEFLDICNKHYVHTAIETCLFASKETLAEIAEKVNYIQFDIKTTDRNKHIEITSVDNDVILENAAYLLKSSKELLVRVPLVPGLNDSEAELHELGRFISSNRDGASLELLRYHRMGVGKYEELGRKYRLHKVKTPSDADIEQAAEILKSYPINVIYK